MPLPTHATVQLARFDALRSAGALDAGGRPGVRFLAVGADCRAAGMEPASRQAYTFLVLGLHDDEGSARALLDERAALAPWFADATETWAAVLRPCRHKGRANYVDPAEPGPFLAPLVPLPPADRPLLVLTSVGYETDGLDVARVADFVAGVQGIRMSMTSVPGLHAQHSFTFPGGFSQDAVTVSFWRDDASVRAFAYEPGVHRAQLDRYHATRNADRTSFTRFVASRSEGTWFGVDPLPA